MDSVKVRVKTGAVVMAKKSGGFPFGPSMPIVLLTLGMGLHTQRHA